MFNLPVDLIRHIYKILLTETPLEIFNFNDEMFEKGEYINEERDALIIFAINRNFEITNKPLFHNKNKKFLNSFNFKNNICYLDSIDNLGLLWNTNDKSLWWNISNLNLIVAKYIWFRDKNSESNCDMYFRFKRYRKLFLI